MRKFKKDLILSLVMLAAFILWTVLVCYVDVQPIGPRDSAVGFAAVNGLFHSWTGAHMTLYHITDWLGLVPVAVGFGFAILGLVQWIRRKNILKVDFSILVLGVYYLVVLAVYLLFEEVVINCRPVLIDGYLEASYPSSTTMLVMCVTPTATMQLKARIGSRGVCRCIAIVNAVFVAFMVIGRLISGVHWLTDIVGGVLLSAGLVMLYRCVCHLERK